MKTSSKIVVCAIALLIAGIGWYDQKLKKLFDSGSYLVPYVHYTDLHLANFHHIRNESSSDINMNLLQGPYRVLLEPSATAYTNVKVINDTLVISAGFNGGYRGNSEDFLLYVFCPSLSSLHCGATSVIDGHSDTDTISNEFYNRRQTRIESFRLDTLSITEDYGSDIRLENNKVNTFRADVGMSPGSGSQLVFGDSNRIEHAHLNIHHKSRLLFLDALHAAELNYELDEQARMILYGRANHDIQKNISNTQP